MERHLQPHGLTGRPALPRREKEGRIGLAPPKSGSATDNAEQKVWSEYDQLQHAPLTYMGEHQRVGREAEDLERRSPSAPRRVQGAAAPSAAPSALEDTPLGAPAIGGGAKGRRKPETEFESASEEAGEMEEH